MERAHACCYLESADDHCPAFIWRTAIAGAPLLASRNTTSSIDAGILTEYNPVELLEGWIVPKMTRKPPHDGTIDLANGVLLAYLAAWLVRTHSAGDRDR